MLQKSLATANFSVMTILMCQIILARAKKKGEKKRGKKKGGGGSPPTHKVLFISSFYWYLPFNMVGSHSTSGYTCY